MRKILSMFSVIAAVLPITFACEEVDVTGQQESVNATHEVITLPDVAKILSEISLGDEQIREVHDAVSSSLGNGYDEEYTMQDLFKEPGSGVGDEETKALGLPTKASGNYSRPLRDLITEYLKTSTKAISDSTSTVSPEEYLAALMSSDVQIYWPYSEKWDGKAYPIITFDPNDGSTKNEGYKMIFDDAGNYHIEEVLVDEDMAKATPVWVVNRNSDSEYSSLEMLRRQDPDWGVAGGSVVIGYNGSTTKAESDGEIKTLILKDLTAKRNFDPWFAGASEFFVKCGAVEDFTATTEEEMSNYSPSITDFMIIVRRDEVDVKKDFNAVLVSQWTDQLENCAFMLIEDDGGRRTSWQCEANVRVKSKNYGFDIELPFNVKDDIVWRGKLSKKYFERYSGTTGHFGDVDLTFEVVTR